MANLYLGNQSLIGGGLTSEILYCGIPSITTSNKTITFSRAVDFSKEVLQISGSLIEGTQTINHCINYINSTYTDKIMFIKIQSSSGTTYIQITNVSTTSIKMLHDYSGTLKPIIVIQAIPRTDV